MSDLTFPSAATAAPAGAVLPERHPNAPRPGELVPSHYHRCFGCGSDHPTGMHMRLTAGDGLELTGVFEVTEHHQAAPGLAHGGLITTAFDEAMGALNWMLYLPAVTGRLETDFRRPVPVGATLHIRAWLTGVDRRKTYMQAEGRLESPDGQLAARAAAVFITVPLAHFEKHGRAEDLAAAADRTEVLDTFGAFEVNP